MPIQLSELDRLIAAHDDPLVVVLTPADWNHLDQLDDAQANIERGDGQGFRYRGLMVMVGSGPRVFSREEFRQEWGA